MVQLIYKKLIINSKHHLSLLIAVFFLSSTVSLFASSNLDKTINKNFPITANGTTTLSNKHGKMNINIWEKNEVKVSVKISVDTDNEERGKQVLDAIEIDFSNGSDYVTAETEIDSRNWGKNNQLNYKIEYEVYMPATNRLVAKMKYGNLRLGKLTGQANIEVKHGNFHLESVGENSRIKVGYSGSTCTIVEAKDLTCDVSYSKLHIYQAEDIEMESEYCQGIEIESCANLEIDSGYDRLTIGKLNDLILDTEYSNVIIGTVENAKIEGDFTNVKIEELKNALKINLSYNNCVIDRVHRGFSEINMKGNHASFKLEIEEGSSYQLSAEGRYSDVRFDEEGMKIKKDIRKTNSFEIQGSKGSANARSRILADLSYGGLKIREY